MLTRKHFTDIAQAIGSTNSYDELVKQLKLLCKRHNGRFNESKFDAKIQKVRVENGIYLH